MMPKQTSLLHYPVHPISLEEGLREVESSLSARNNLHIVTLNPEMLMQAEQDEVLKRIVKSAGLVIPDGAGVVWALRKKGLSSLRRLPGIEFSESLLALAAKKGYRIALIGAAETVLQAVTKNLQAKYPGLQLVYIHPGFFASPEAEEKVARDCAEQKPDLLFVALGVPKQEKWIHRYQSLFQSTIFVGVGGSFDIWSGLKKRAPDFFLKLNLEWLYRITSEPWRIKRTYKILPLFVVKVLMSSD